MKRKIKNVNKVVTQMTDPKPEFVSLVDHGANQTPFKSVKADNTVVADLRTTKEPSEETSIMAKNNTKVNKSDLVTQAEIHKIVFKGDLFSDEVRVEDYLASKGYTDAIVVGKTDGSFQVAGKAKSSFVGDIKEIKLDNGVTYHVGTLKAEETKLEEVTEATKASEDTVTKYNMYFAEWSNGVTIEDVMRDGADGLPPGIYEINDAFYTALRNLIVKGDVEGVKGLTAEFGNVIIELVNVLRSATIPAEEIEKVAGKMFDTNKEVKEVKEVAKADTKETPVVKEQEPAKEETPVEGDTPEGTKVAPVEEETKADESENISKSEDATVDAVAKAIEAALSPIVKSVEGLTTAISNNAEESKKSLADMQEQVSKTGERVDDIENVRQTRKSAEDEGNPVEPKEKVNKVDRASLRDTLGFM